MSYSKNKKALNHSSLHILAKAVNKLYPKVKLGSGTVTKEIPGLKTLGFYYDFKVEEPFDKEALEKVEKKLKELIDGNLKFKRKEIPQKEALKKFKGNEFKKELIAGETQICQLDGFSDTCNKEDLIKNSKEIGAVELIDSSSVYWKGDANNPTMQRIYGIAFESKKAKEEYLSKREELEKRDHIKIGRRQDIFLVDGEIAPGMPLYFPKGQVIRRELTELMRDINKKYGFSEVRTPHIYKSEMWKRSGHYEAYKDKMFIFEVDGEEFAVKPMNCPGHIRLYEARKRSYRDLPIRYSEFGTVYRKEQSGELNGLLRSIAITQDDAHIFCREDQVREELKKTLKASIEVWKVFDLDYKLYLSTMPEKHIGDEKEWKKVIQKMEEVLDELELDYELNKGEGAFYGPKFDFEIEDALGRLWQCSTIQLDFFMPERFKLSYIGEGNEEKRPIMIHRAILGSLNRFMGVMMENFAGRFPTWLSPVQVKVLSLADRNNEYARGVAEELEREGIRVELDTRNKTLGYKIRQAQEEKVPYMLILGDNEEEDNTISVRKRTEEEEHGVKLKNFISDLKKRISNRDLEL